jgi:UDP-GlcNAc:undecaprenyl-phosphate/decaprenyl-phosphate GlcNAc-1-phosphate transferase
MMPVDLAAFLLTGGATFALTPLVIAEARKAGALDYPGVAKIHAHPVPTLGGLGLVATFLAMLWLLEWLGLGLALSHTAGLTLAAIPVVAIGIRDDVWAVSIPAKLGVHFLAGAILYAAGLRVVELTNPFGPTLSLGPLALPVTMLWVATVINALNLVDGLDGLAPGIGGIAAVTLYLVGTLQGERDVAVPALLLAGAVAGFYPYNFPRARVFLGDVGSTFIGLVLAAIALLENRKTTAAMTLLLPLVALGLPLVDTLFAVARRTVRGRNPLRRDTGHLHHRLLRLGLSPSGAVGCLLGASGVFGLVAVLLSRLPKQSAFSVTALLGLVVLVALAVLTWLERRVRNGAP